MQQPTLFGTDRDLEVRYGIKRRNWQKMRMLGSGPRFRKVNNRLCIYNFSDVEEWLAGQPLMRSTVEQVAA